MSASVNLPLHRKVQKFSSGIGSRGWSQKKGRKMVVCVCVCVYVCAQGDTKNDLLLFTLAALLSSTLVYNSRGTIDQHAIDRLRSVAAAVILSILHKQ